MASQPTTVHNVEVVDESPLKSELSVSPKTTVVIPLTKEQLKNKTDHTILNDVLRMIAQNAPAIAPQTQNDIVEIRTRAKRGTNYYNSYDSYHKNDHAKLIPTISMMFSLLTIISFLM